MLKAKEFPAQTENRRQWILDVLRENQRVVSDILMTLENSQPELTKWLLNDMHKNDRDALLQPNGILTDQQIKALS